jgi:SPP1 family phage portal protein
MAGNENNTENKGYGRALFGRRVLYTDVTEITADNVASVVQNVFPNHVANVDEINYLYNYYKGKQPILERVKKVREEINSKVVTNYANEIVSFKVGYLLNSPFQYVALTDKNEEVNILNSYMYQVGKQAQDQEVIEWNHICGTAYRYVEAKEPSQVEKGDSPFDLYTLDPRTTAIIYSSTFKKKRMAAITYTISSETNTVRNFVIYTKDKIFTYAEDTEKLTVSGLEEKPNTLGEIPVFEYPANNARLGAFEIVLPLLDAINRINSNDVDAGDTQIQSFLKFINCDLDGDALENLAAYGAIKIKSIDGAPADVDTVKTDYSYDGANITKQDIHNAILTICGMPVMGNGSSISANNGAILIQNGWSQAEARAKSSETMFKGSERTMLELVFKICRTISKDNVNLRISDVDCKSTRTNYENVQVKAQVLCEMLNTPRVHPKLAFEACGLFSDPENAYLISEEHYEKTLEDWNVEDVLELDKAVNGNGTGEAD